MTLHSVGFFSFRPIINHSKIFLIKNTFGIFLVAAALSSCATDKTIQTKTTDSPEQTAPETLQLDPHALCTIYTQIKDRQGSSRLEKYHAAARKKSSAEPKNRALTFSAILSVDNSKEAWKALREDAKTHSSGLLLPLGECLIYGWWKMSDQAEPRCQEAEKKTENLALVDVARAETWLLKEDFEKALSFADAAITADASCGAGHMVKAQILAQQKNNAAAISSWRNALKASPECFLCATEQAVLVEHENGQEAALPYWEAALKILPSHAKTLQRYAAVQVGRNDDAALKAYEKALTLGQEDFATLMAAATLAVKTGDDGKAIDFAERAARVESAHIDLWRLLGSLYQKQNENEDFEKAMVEILRLIPNDVEAHLNLARIAKKEERMVDALEHFDAISDIFKNEKANEADAALREAFETENQSLLAELKIQKPLTGNIGSIQIRAQRIVQTLFEARHKRNKKGNLTITVRTHKDGSVEAVTLTENTLGDSYIAASLVGNLRRAKINGGRKLWTLDFEFQ